MREQSEQHNPKRVLFVSHSSALGGAEGNLLRLLSALDRGQYEPVVVFPQEGPLKSKIEAMSIATRISPLSWWIPATHWTVDDYLAQVEGLGERVELLENLIIEEQVDLVHTNTIVTLEGALASCARGVPHIWHSRGRFGLGWPPSYFDDTAFFLSVVDLLSEAIICASESVRAQMISFCRRTPLWAIHDGYDFDAFLSQPIESEKDFRAQYALEGRSPLVVSVGGIQRRKGQMDLVEAAVIVTRDLPGVVFILAGDATDSSYVDHLMTRISQTGLENNFRFLGFQQNILNLLDKVDLFVHPSHSEGFPAVVLEAMAVAKPVIATRSGGHVEIIEQNVSGVLVDVQSPGELAEAILRLLSQPEAARAIARAGSEKVRTLTLQDTARQTEQVYQRVLKDAGGSLPCLALRRRLCEFVRDETLTRARLASG